MILADSTLIIDFLRGKKEAIGLVEKYEQILCTTEINVFEIMTGAHIVGRDIKNSLNKIMAITSIIGVLPLDRKASLKASEINAGLIKKGIKIEPMDALIGGIALSQGITKIITNNKKHFSRIEGLKIISY